MIRNVAFFDLDGTLIPPPSSERMFLKHLIQNNVVTWTDMLRFVQGIVYNSKGGRHGIFKRNKFYLKEKNVELIEHMAQEYVEHYIYPLISRDAQHVIAQHKANNDVLIMISGSPYFIVKVCAQMLGFNDYKGTDLIINDGKFTGKIKGIHPYGKNKVAVVQDFIAHYALDINHSTIYANHGMDRYILALSPRPVAVNPSRRLQKYCKKKGWEILYL